MDINNIDLELNVKMIETLKKLLKDINVDISFEIHNNIEELLNISLDGYNFKLYKYSEIKTTYKNYYNFLPNKIIKLLKPIIGNSYIKKSELLYYYKLNYNNVIIELDKLTYNKLDLYTRYVYKLKQLSKLNKKLGIKKEYNIILDDDVILDDMYKSFHKYFKNIIK